jgi:hypothetical protein
LGLSKEYGRKEFEVNQFFKKNIRAVALPQAELCDCFALEILSKFAKNKRVEQLCEYLLENCIDADCNFPLSLWSECTASLLRTIKACE